jgi:hypothetical protein
MAAPRGDWPWRREWAAGARTGRAAASSARPSPMTKAMKVSACAVDCSALRACASQVAWALSTSTKPCAATATSSTWAATMAITSSERRSRPAGSTRIARRVSPRSAAQTPSHDSSRAPISAAITSVRLSGCSACWKPSSSAAPIACSLARSSGQASRRSFQNAPLSGEAARLVSSASNCWRRCDTRSVPRWRTSIDSSLASRMSASSALRSLVNCARWRVMFGVFGGTGGGRVAQFAEPRVQVGQVAGAGGNELVGLHADFVDLHELLARIVLASGGGAGSCSGTGTGRGRSLGELCAQFGDGGRRRCCCCGGVGAVVRVAVAGVHAGVRLRDGAAACQQGQQGQDGGEAEAHQARGPFHGRIIEAAIS